MSTSRYTGPATANLRFAAPDPFDAHDDDDDDPRVPRRAAAASAVQPQHLELEHDGQGLHHHREHSDHHHQAHVPLVPLAESVAFEQPSMDELAKQAPLPPAVFAAPVAMLRELDEHYFTDLPESNAPELEWREPRIGVIGVGGGGCNTVDNMIARDLAGCDFFVANTDAQQLRRSLAPRRIQLGRTLTRGCGAGARIDLGAQAARENLDDVVRSFRGYDMAFVTAGMGGGTGTGAAPVIAAALREIGVLTVGLVTKPFAHEGKKRMANAMQGLEQMKAACDSIIVIENQMLLSVGPAGKSFIDSFAMVNNVLFEGVRSVTYPIVNPGLVNIDFADLRTVMAGSGRAMMSTGEASGADRARDAAQQALNNPLLEAGAIKDASGLMVCISGGTDLTLAEFDEIAQRMRDSVSEDAEVIVGNVIDESLHDRVRVSLIVTGIKDKPAAGSAPRYSPVHTLPHNTAAPADTVEPAAGVRAWVAKFW